MKIRALVIATCLLAAPFEVSAMPLSSVAQVFDQQTSAQTMIDQVQYRRSARPVAPRGNFRGNNRVGRRGNNGAAAAIIGLGVLGAIAASQAAPSDCYIERRRVFDDYGRYAGVRRVRVCR